MSDILSLEETLRSAEECYTAFRTSDFSTEKRSSGAIFEKEYSNSLLMHGFNQVFEGFYPDEDATLEETLIGTSSSSKQKTENKAHKSASWELSDEQLIVQKICEESTLAEAAISEYLSSDDDQYKARFERHEDMFIASFASHAEYAYGLLLKLTGIQDPKKKLDVYSLHQLPESQQRFISKHAKTLLKGIIRSKNPEVAYNTLMTFGKTFLDRYNQTKHLVGLIAPSDRQDNNTRWRIAALQNFPDDLFGRYKRVLTEKGMTDGEAAYNALNDWPAARLKLVKDMVIDAIVRFPLLCSRALYHVPDERLHADDTEKLLQGLSKDSKWSRDTFYRFLNSYDEMHKDRLIQYGPRLIAALNGEDAATLFGVLHRDHADQFTQQKDALLQKVAKSPEYSCKMLDRRYEMLDEAQVDMFMQSVLKDAVWTARLVQGYSLPQTTVVRGWNLELIERYTSPIAKTIVGTSSAARNDLDKLHVRAANLQHQATVLGMIADAAEQYVT